MTAGPCRARRGVTLIELLVVMVVGSIALGLVASISVRQQRAYADLADASALSGQLRDAAAILPIDLRGAASGAGDIREARDTSIELRGTIASAVVCDTTAGSLVLAPSVAGVGTFASYLTSIDVGDTAWVYTTGDMTTSGDRRVSASSSAPSAVPARRRYLEHRLSGACVGGRIDALPLFQTLIGMPVRDTAAAVQPYRASTARVCRREGWSTIAKTNIIQPVVAHFPAACDHVPALIVREPPPFLSPTLFDRRGMRELRGQTQRVAHPECASARASAAIR